jgi:hypothetical protein
MNLRTGKHQSVEEGDRHTGRQPAVVDPGASSGRLPVEPYT